MKKIAVIIEDLFDDLEYKEPVEAFLKEGHQIIHVGLEKGKKVKSKKEGFEIVVEEKADKETAHKYDALLIPGGYAPDRLRAFQEPVDCVAEFMELKKPVFTICHGPQLLINAEKVKGRRITGFRSIKIDLINAGADFIDVEVVVDDNLVSSRTPLDLPVFIRESLNLLK
jgi:protease I